MENIKLLLRKELLILKEKLINKQYKFGEEYSQDWRDAILEQF
jgi:hypothetical protein